jgi:uncharacterized membrane protein YebE (DUF533 family)
LKPLNDVVEGVAMRLGPIIGSLLGSFGGRAIGGALGGNTGRMIGSLAGSLLGSSASGNVGGMLSGLFGGNHNNLGNQGGQHNQQQNQQHNQAHGQQVSTPQQQPGSQSDGQSLQAYPGAAQATFGEVSEEHAAVIIKAMCTAAKSDGTVDEAELNAILGRLGEIGPEESAFLRSELAGPVDLSGLLASVPKGMEQEIYAVSLLAIDTVSGPEAAYLSSLASGLGLSEEATNHMKQALANA